MRSSSIVLAAALATAACSSGPSKQQKDDAQSEMRTCMGVGNAKGLMARYAPKLTGVAAQLDGLDAEKITAQKYPDFTIRGSLPSYTETSKDGKDTVTSEMNVGVTFKSVNGVFAATLAGSKTTTNQDGETRNFPFYSENIDVKSNNFKGMDVALILTEGQGCSIVAQQKLGLKP